VLIRFSFNFASHCCNHWKMYKILIKLYGWFQSFAFTKIYLSFLRSFFSFLKFITFHFIFKYVFGLNFILYYFIILIWIYSLIFLCAYEILFCIEYIFVLYKVHRPKYVYEKFQICYSIQSCEVHVSSCKEIDLKLIDYNFVQEINL